ncbi:MAG: protein kinase [Bryobacteraceae bacterium]|nr:protein kinase [Bryobacteraceae bacterium]
MDLQTRALTIFQEALKAPRDERFTYVTTACGPDPELRGMVTALLNREQRSGDGEPTAMIVPPAAAPASASPPVWPGSRSRVFHSEDLSGHTIGYYELLRLIGKGGMGTVYAARRADQEFNKLVAVKLVKPGMESEEILRRFKHERQVLAGLDHPNIARLLDGGTEDGTPYLVMEYVEGTAIDVYCKTQQLPVAEKLNLFCTVCSAVQYAHQSLVVHRDIKPPNIMVSTEGVPKLLDFGIAKVLHPDFTDQPAMTMASQKPMTPEYASPEQVRGEPVTTASDVYALGLLLYELLTTVHPLRTAYELVGLHKAVLETDPERPSEMLRHIANGPDASDTPAVDLKRLALKLHGDLDAIVMMCLRKEANRRYASVQHLIDDINRYLEGLPVKAHADSAGYRIGKFMRRHTASVVAGVTIAAALLISSTISWVFYHRANVERRRAESRFDDVRQFSTYVLFDLDKVLDLGITPARNALLEKATEYLGRLERDQGGDLAMEHELIRGYLKIGDSRGSLYGPNLGDREGAKRSYTKALALLEKSKNPDAVLLAQTEVRLADLMTQDQSPKDALGLYEKALAVLDGASARNDLEARRALAEVLPRFAFAQIQAGMPQQALASYEKGVRVVRELMRSSGATPELRKLEARSELRLGETWAKLGRTDDGLVAMRRAVSTYQELADAAPDSPLAQRPVATSAAVLGDVLTTAGRHAEAADAYRRALSVVELLAAADPRNAQYARDVCTFLGRLGASLAKSGQMVEGRAVTRRLVETLRPRVAQSDATKFDLYQYAWTLVTTPYLELRNPPEALRAAERLADLTGRRDPARLDVLARAYAATGQTARALETDLEALRLLPPGTASELRADLERQIRDFRQRR